MIRVRINRQRRVSAMARVVVPMPPERVAAEMDCLRHFVTHDLFHAGLTAEAYGSDGEPRRGSRVTIEHRFCGLRVVRVGRLLWRTPGRGFGFSDLSARDPRHGFPHTCHYRLRPTKGGGSALSIVVVGRWTLRAVPRPLAKTYITLVLALSGVAMRNHLLRVERWHAQRRVPHELDNGAGA